MSGPTDARIAEALEDIAEEMERQTNLLRGSLDPEVNE